MMSGITGMRNGKWNYLCNVSMYVEGRLKVYSCLAVLFVLVGSEKRPDDKLEAQREE